MKRLPPKWLSRLEMRYYKHKAVFWIAVYLLVFIVWPLATMESEPLDIQLLQGIDRD